nr:hypothetical protein [Tanacetum cinerariifolium]
DLTRSTTAAPAATTKTAPTIAISVTNAQLKAMIDQGVTEAMAARDADRNMNGEGNHNSGMGVKRTERVTRKCTYTNFLKCQPINSKGTEGVTGLTQWFERIETFFDDSKCAVENQVKFATCTLHGVALTWWKSHVKIVCQDIANHMPWSTLMKLITIKYCPWNEIPKLEAEMWELKVKDKIEKYVGDIPDMIYGSVMASKPQTMQKAIEFAIGLMDKKICTFAKRQEYRRHIFQPCLTLRETSSHTTKLTPKVLGITRQVSTLHLQLPHVSLQFLDFISRTILNSHQFHKCASRHVVSDILTNCPDMGFPPC